MSECMPIPDNWKDFVKEYSFKDIREVYTNGSWLIPTFRVEQMMEHYCHEWISVKDKMSEERLQADVVRLTIENEKLLNKIAKIQFELDDVVSEWISVKDRLPEFGEHVLVFSPITGFRVDYIAFVEEDEEHRFFLSGRVTHWMPLPQKPESEVDEEWK